MGRVGGGEEWIHCGTFREGMYFALCGSTIVQALSIQFIQIRCI